MPAIRQSQQRTYLTPGGEFGSPWSVRSSVSVAPVVDPLLDEEREEIELEPAQRPGQPFRLSAKAYFLTYSQVGGADCAALTAMLSEFRPAIKTWKAVEERHGDGGRHWHVIAIWDRRLRNTRVDVFDVAGLHPNIRVIGSKPTDLERLWAYIHKEEGALQWGPWEGPIKVDDTINGKQAKWTYIVASKDEEEFRERVRVLDPMNHVLQHDKINGYARQRYTVEEEEYEPEFREFPWVPEALTAWVNGEMKKKHRPKALIIWGPTRTGKTEWARSIGCHNYFNGLFNVDDFDQDKDYIVLDDINPDFFPNYKGWIGAQKNTTLTDKYRPKRSVQWGKPCIWLSNDDPSTYKTWDWDWVRENAVVVNLTHKLYGAEDPRPAEDRPLEWPGTPRNGELDEGLAYDGNAIRYYEDVVGNMVDL